MAATSFARMLEASVRGLTTGIQEWSVSSQRQACRNAMVASTDCAQRRAARQDAADHLDCAARRQRPATAAPPDADEMGDLAHRR